jgi:molecular chaperone HtpG
MSGEKKKTARAAPGPYRSGGETVEAGESDGLVGDLVRQFADPYALFRELVQNAIDAGATRIGVRALITREGKRLEARVSVTDDGCGMTQEVLEQDLVVLFKSTKEDRGDTIGKFGIGFVSVLAIAPSLVVVSSCTGDEARHVLHLHPDRTYDLYRESGGTRGTTVTLHVPLEDDGRELVARSEAALRRWCGHARVPIHWTVVRADEASPSTETRIDAPMDVADALVSVDARSHDGEIDAIVALVPESGRHAAYYNRGLLLHESRIGGTRAAIAFKVASPHLSHTLSREDVRLDDAHARAVALVEHVIAKPLTRAVIEAISEAARAHVGGDADAGARWLAIVTSARAADLAIAPSEIDVPVLAPIGGARVVRCLGDGGTVLRADARDALVDVLASGGVAVIDRTIAKTDDDRQSLDGLLAAIAAAPSVAPESRHTAIVPIPPEETSDDDRALLDRTATLLGRVLRRPSRLGLADVVGRDDRIAFVLAHDGPQLARDPGEEADPFRLALRPALVLRSTHPIVTLARAHPDPVIAADVLARAVMVERDLATEERSAVLADAGCRALFAGRGDR